MGWLHVNVSDNYDDCSSKPSLLNTLDSFTVSLTCKFLKSLKNPTVFC